MADNAEQVQGSRSIVGPVFFQSNAVAMPETADMDKGTIDCVWYTGQAVTRQDGWSDPYALRLDMGGARLDRLNAGAPIFDSHFSGQDYKSIATNQAGTKAQRGVVKKAWSEGAKGKATLQFDMGDPDGAELFRKVSTGIVQNLSPGVQIFQKQKEIPQGGLPKLNGQEIDQYVATDWEPFEISCCTVPADYDTSFLSGTQPEGTGAIRPKEQPMAEKPQPAGDAARVDQVVLDAKLAEGVQLERTRVKGITDLAQSFSMQALGQKLIADGTCTLEVAKQRLADASEIKRIGTGMVKHGLAQEFLNGLAESGVTIDDARKQMVEKLAADGQKDANGKPFPIASETGHATAGEAVSQFGKMQDALLLRFNPQFYLSRRVDPVTGSEVYLEGFGAERQKKAMETAREYRGFTLMDMARESLELRGVKTRGMSKWEVATKALFVRQDASEYLAGGMETTSDFPSILANVLNKTLRQAYEAYPQTFKPFSRQTTASDFKPVLRAQLNDLPALQQLNEKGEFHRTFLTDSGIGYALVTFGNVVAITRKAIINDDTNAFTRTSMQLGVAAAQAQSNVVWGLITANTQKMQDGNVLFHAAHGNLYTGAGSAFGLGAATPPTGLAKGRVMMRQQKGPGGTPLDLIPRYLCIGTNLETPASQALVPTNIASSDYTKVVPEWVRSVVPIVEPRLDPSTGSTYPWLLVADPAQIDTIEYAFLEGQEGIYYETKQGFDVDGLEVKARMDFAAAAIEQRGMLYAAGA